MFDLRPAALALCCFAGISSATDEPDADFGTGGQVLLPFDLGETGFDQAYSVLPLADGGVLLAGAVEKGSGEFNNRDMALARLLPDGGLDPDFGSGGRRTIAFDLGGFSDSVEDLLFYPGNRVVAVGTAEDVEGVGGFGAVAVARLHLDGTLDTSFSFDGKTSLVLQVDGADVPASARRAAVQDDGHILIVGSVYRPGELPAAFLLRLLPDGSPDPDFGTQGMRLILPGTADPLVSLGSTLALRPDGRIVMAGAGFQGPGTDNVDPFVVQLMPDGSLDPSFGAAGVTFVGYDQGLDNIDILRDIALDPQGRATLAGYAQTTAGGNDIAVARLLPDGDLDPAFGTGGRALVGFDRGGALFDEGNALVLSDDGRITVAGSCNVGGGNTDIALLRLDGNGQPDPGFGSGGQLVIGIDASPPTFVDENAQALAFDAQGRLVVAGLAYVGPQPGNYDMLVLRFASERLFGDGFETTP